MRQVAIFFSIILGLSSTGYGWFSTTIDTVEVHYPSGQLKEKYQTVFWGGNETTRKYGFYRSFFENGQLEWEGQYEQNAKIGTWIKWDSTGFRLGETLYANGLKNGADIEWNPDGTFRKVEYYKNDTLHGLCRWNKSGAIVNGVFNVPDLVIDSQSFYLQGKLIVNLWSKDTSISYFDQTGPRHLNYNSELDLWYELSGMGNSHSSVNGNPTVLVGRKVDGKKHGKWVSWSESGDMKKVEYYDMGVLLKLE